MRETFFSEILSTPEASWRWSTQGVRPANHPRTRLRQYAEWAGARPDWPARLIALSEKLPAFHEVEAASTTARLRKQGDFRAWRIRFADEICAEVISGSRLDTLICDGAWPLLAARDPARADVLGHWWRHWFSGDVPAKWLALLRGLHVIGAREWPASHGSAQGLLGWLLAEEKKQNFGDSAEGRGT